MKWKLPLAGPFSRYVIPLTVFLHPRMDEADSSCCLTIITWPQFFNELLCEAGASRNLSDLCDMFYVVRYIMYYIWLLLLKWHVMSRGGCF